MSERDWYLAERTMDARITAELSQAKARRLARLATQQQQNQLVWQFRWLMCELGYRLVALGAWLEGFSLAQAQPVEVKAARKEAT